MKVVSVVAVVLSLVVSGCAISVNPSPPGGGIVTSVTAPDVGSTFSMRTGADMSGVTASKSGSATCGSVLGLFSFGNCGLDAAMKSGNITKVHHVDYKKTVVLYGLAHNLTTIVYGE